MGCFIFFYDLLEVLQGSLTSLSSKQELLQLFLGSFFFAILYIVIRKTLFDNIFSWNLHINCVKIIFALTLIAKKKHSFNFVLKSGCHFYSSTCGRLLAYLFLRYGVPYT